MFTFIKTLAFRLGLLLSMLLIQVSIAHAIEIKGLYETEILVNSQSQEDRLFAVKQSLYAVLNRVVVAEDISKLPVVQGMLANPMPYVKQFQYASLYQEDSENPKIARLFKVDFDENAILKAFKSSQLAIWDEMRPQTLVWMVVSDQGEREFLNADNLPHIDHELKLASKVKGLSFIYPVLDLDEQQIVTVDNLAKIPADQLASLSSRYDVASFVVVVLKHYEDCWQGSWTLYFDGKKTEWSGLCQPLRPTLLAGAQGVYQVLSNFYAAKPDLPRN